MESTNAKRGHRQCYRANADSSFGRLAAKDAALSRVWAGEHTPLDDLAGRHLGAQVASFVLTNFDPLRAAQVRQARG